jgi:hypothetical protein
MIEAEKLNADCQSGRLQGIRVSLRSQGDAWYSLIEERCPHLFARVPVYISFSSLQQMTDVIAAIERVVKNEKWQQKSGLRIEDSGSRTSKGVFYGYDFHVNSEGASLIEINTNAGGGFLNALIQSEQRDLQGIAVAESGLERVFIDMFKNEWRLMRGYQPLSCLAIVDEKPEGQYLYPEFLYAQRLFERAGIKTLILDPSALVAREDGLYASGHKIDMVYNRLTDFSLQQYPALLEAWQEGTAVLTPDPWHYARYADKRNLARLTDADELKGMGASAADIGILQKGIPHTFVVQKETGEQLWEARKKLFFKPVSGYGSRGAYRGEKLTRRVFGEILEADYIAQQLAPPGERCVAEGVLLKYDVRCYVYDGKVQLLAARLYQGQTTNFRTPHGGFAQVRVVG